MRRKKQAWSDLNTRQKIQQVWDYYKLPIFIVFVFLYMIGYSIFRHATVKENLFYTAVINVAPNQELTGKLHTDFESQIVSNPRKEKMQFYSGLYLTDDTHSEYFQYSYTSQMKILAAIDSKQLDIVLMDKESFDAFSQNGYLCQLDEFTEEFPELKDITSDLLTENLYIVESNAKDVALDPSVEYYEITETHYYGLDMSKTGILADANLSGTVYLGIIANSPRKELCAQYIDYLLT